MNGVALAALVAVAAALGAPSRYALEWGVHRRWPTRTPFGTLLVNGSGSLALGIVVGLAVAHGLDPDVRAVVGTGFLGAYTTFSAFTDQTYRLATTGHPRVALAYAVGSVVVASTAAAIGLALVGGL